MQTIAGKRKSRLRAEKTKEPPTTDLYLVRAQPNNRTLGLRERNKIDKLARISDATQRLFSRYGYEGTTLRAIANEAAVALGTLSLYAHDKRDLIVLLFNKLIPPLMAQGSGQTFPKGRLADNLVTYFTPFYYAYAAEAKLYRIILGHIYSSTPSVHVREFTRIRTVLIDTLSDLILRARASGECSNEGNLARQAKSFFYLYFAAVREWLMADQPDPEQGMADLREMFELHIRGLRKYK